MIRKLTRDDIVKMIKKNGGTAGLDLSKYDLSGISLSRLDLRGVKFGTDWRTPHLNKANLKDVRFERCNLQGADFIHTDLSSVSFYGSNLQDSIMGVANCTNTTFRKANLQGVNFHGARLIDTDFVEADLRNADYHSAYIADIDLAKAQIGDKLLFEDEKKYRAFLERHLLEKTDIDSFIATRFLITQQTYLILKNCFISKGLYKEASWAHMKERQAEKMTHWPISRAKYCFVDELEGLANSGVKRTWQMSKFIVRHATNYILDWIAELTCGYGEKPLRTIAWATVMILVFPLLYWLSAGIATIDNKPMTMLDYLNYSLGIFATVGFSNFVTVNPLAQTLTSIEAILGISLLALLMFTLGNRISRS